MLEIIKRHQSISIPLAMVLILDLGLLGINFAISAQLEKDSININIAGRQRMLSQRIAKAVLLMDYQLNKAANIDRISTEIQRAQQLFDQTLKAFQSGGMVIDASGNRIHIDALSISNASAILAKAQQPWNQLNQALTQLLSRETINIGQLQLTLGLLDKNTESLLASMNELTVNLEQYATQKTYLLRVLQTMILILILASFLLATARVVRRDKYYKHLMEHSADIVVSINLDDKLISFISQSVSQLLGLPPENFLGQPAINLFHPASHQEVLALLDEVQKSKTIPKDRYEVELIDTEGKPIYADMVIQLSQSEDSKSLELNADLRDISERKAAELELAELAHKDPLTHLPNRILFYELADQCILESRRKGTMFAVMFIDIDGFKMINDQFGHACGDQMLQAIANDLRNCVRASDMIARIGGDEFIVLLKDIACQEDIKLLADKIIKAISTSKVLDGHHCQVGASIGVAIYPNHGDDIDTLVNNADHAMYQVKNADKNGVAFAS